MTKPHLVASPFINEYVDDQLCARDQEALQYFVLSDPDVMEAVSEMRTVDSHLRVVFSK